MRALADRRIYSHNVTPAHFFAGWEQPAVQEAALWGRAQLRATEQVGVPRGAQVEVGDDERGHAPETRLRGR